jgi:hypothetical protein
VQFHGFVQEAASPHFPGERLEDIAKGGALAALGEHLDGIDQVNAGAEEESQLAGKCN